MKKIKSLVMILPLVLVMFVTTNQAEAATSSWQSVSGVSGCQVRVWTDATTYYKSASTVDWYAQTNGSCGTLNYAASLKHPSQNITQILDGSFSNQTPTNLLH